MPTLLHSYPITDPSEGGDILFSVWDCIRPTTPCTTSAHMHTQTHTHSFQHHTRFYSWMKSINGSSEQVARQWTLRPGRHANPGFPGLHHNFFFFSKLTDPSKCTLKNETLACTRNKGMLGNLTIQASGVGISLQVVEARYQVVCFLPTL